MIEYTNSGITSIINEYVHKSRDRQILIHRYVDGLTYEQLAEKFDLSVKQIKNIVYKHQNTIFSKVKSV